MTTNKENTSKKQPAGNIQQRGFYLYRHRQSYEREPAAKSDDVDLKKEEEDA